MVVLHRKIQELKATAAAINYRNLSVNAFGELVTDYSSSLDKRIVKGYLVLWGSKNLYGEVFQKGAFAKSISEHGPDSKASYEIKFLNQHDSCDPLSLFAKLEEDSIGLYFETVPLDEIDSADRVLTQLKSRTLNNFSIGFNYVWDKMKYDEASDSIFIYECTLLEGSVVSIPAELNTYAIRSVAAMESLYDDTENFINTLPRSLRMEARKLFAIHKSLINAQPPDLEQESTGAKDKPADKKAKRSLKLNYVTKNL